MSDREDDPLTKATSAPSTSTTKEVKISKARSQSPSAKPTAAPVVTLTTPSSPTEEARLTRSNTPPGLSMELAFKAQSQCGRVATLRRLLNMLPDDATDLNLEEIQRISTQADDLLKAFLKEHSYLEVTWPASCQGHAYITGNFLEAAHNISLDLKLKLAKLKSKAARTTLDEASSSTQPVPAKLPKIALPTFSGNYLQWPAYSELFASLVLNNTSISDVERLQYLRGSLFGAPLQLISALPLTGDSFASSWDILKQTYQNKRLLIQAQLEKLVSLSPVTQRSAKNLSDVIATIRDVDVALSTMATQEERWNALLIYQAVRCIDDVTREAWETHLGTADTFPPKRDLVNFITAKIRALQSVEATAGGSGQKPKPKTVAEAVKGQRSTSHAATQATQSRPPPSQPSTTTRAPPAQNTYPCDCCKEAHFLVSCTKFRAQTLQERLDLVQALSLCYNCLGRHITANCRSTHRCKDCGGRHHTLLHSTPSASKHSISDQQSVATATNLKLTLLATAIAQVSSSTALHDVRLLIDAGSELTFVTESLVVNLGIQRTPSHISIVGIGGNQAAQTRGVATLQVKSIYTDATVTIHAHVLRTLTTILPACHISQAHWPHLDNIKLADPGYLQPRPVDIIIGADYYGQIIKPNLIKGPPTMPIAQLSIFGWLILGPTSSCSSQSHSSYTISTDNESNASIRELLTRFWVQEELPNDSTNQLTSEEQECEEHFLATHSRDSTGRYVVRIPLKSSPKALGNSYKTAHSCLQRTLGKLKKDDEYRELYTTFMNEYAQLGHMLKASSISPDDHSIYYLPHHGVLKPDSTSTKLRVVFNGSSSTTTGLSVNDLMHTGANLMLNISDVLLWIRHHKYIFATDITKMYRQVKVHEDDWKLQRILWVDEEGTETPYNLTTVTYGTKAAPFLAIRTLLQLAEDEGDKYPLATPSIKHARYVDDIFGGSDTCDKLIETARQLVQLCSAGGFPLAKWHSNHTALLHSISPAASSQDATISLDDCNTKILGLRWNSVNDQFTFATKESTHLKLSKRLILSEVAQIFDPLGFLSPVIIRAKMLLQELWLHNLGWDDPLPSQIASRWTAIREDLTSLARLSIPRWFNTYTNSTVELHGFSDASQLAMAAVIYVTVISPSTDLRVTSLVCAKTKVAPLKKLTIPRLELSAALMLAKLVQYVQANLKLNISNVYLWTDSQVTHTWIKSQAARWKDFVRNRVTQIQELTSNAHWRHVPGLSNPADCASRGISTTQLERHPLWWTGPPWLARPSDAWPKISTQTDNVSCALESRPGISNVLTTHKTEYHWDLIYKYSSLNKLLNITAVCFRFFERLRRKSTAAISHPLVDVERAKLFWIKATQSAFFSLELKTLAGNISLPSSHAFSRLTAFIDDQGVIRVGGRLDNAQLEYEGKHPAILPRHSRLTDLVIDASHKRTLHGGTQLTLSHTRQNYWIIGGRAAVKAHVLRCVVCARQRGIRAHQLMGQLPLARVTPSSPFSHTGIDYAGPLTLRTWKGRGAKTQKGWICVFVCFATSAVHLDLVTDYSTEGFIATYRRFTARRGIPHTLYSDCGTNFVGADSTLKAMFSKHTAENRRLTALFVNDYTTWSFNPPAAPHMGGKWEAVVKSIKYHLQRTIKETLLTYEEYATLLTQIEATLNSRPLEPLSDDPEDFRALTPSHFLIGKPISTLPEPTVEHVNLPPRARWQQIQQSLQYFWKRWSTQYLQRMQSISKWHHPSNLIKVGSLVLITDERFPPCKWPLARVLELHPGQDGLTRVVTLKTATTQLTRPTAKLALLPVSDSESTSPAHC